MKERNVRGEVEILRDQNLLEVSNMGMNITEEGKSTLNKLDSIYSHLKDIPKLEQEVKAALDIKEVIIIPGSSLDNDIITKGMGKVTLRTLKETLKDGDIIGITGGSTMAKVAREAKTNKSKRRR